MKKQYTNDLINETIDQSCIRYFQLVVTIGTNAY